MYAERGPRVTRVNALSIITLQIIVPDVRNESRKQSRIVFIAIKRVLYTMRVYY